MENFSAQPATCLAMNPNTKGDDKNVLEEILGSLIADTTKVTLSADAGEAAPLEPDRSTNPFSVDASRVEKSGKNDMHRKQGVSNSPLLPSFLESERVKLDQKEVVRKSKSESEKHSKSPLVYGPTQPTKAYIEELKLLAESNAQLQGYRTEVLNRFLVADCHYDLQQAILMMKERTLCMYKQTRDTRGPDFCRDFSHSQLRQLWRPPLCVSRTLVAPVPLTI